MLYGKSPGSSDKIHHRGTRVLFGDWSGKWLLKRWCLSWDPEAEEESRNQRERKVPPAEGAAWERQEVCGLSRLRKDEVLRQEVRWLQSLMGNHWKVITRFIMTRFLRSSAYYNIIRKRTLFPVWSSNLTPGHISRKDGNSNSERCRLPDIHCSTLYNSQDLEAS